MAAIAQSDIKQNPATIQGRRTEVRPVGKFDFTGQLSGLGDNQWRGTCLDGCIFLAAKIGELVDNCAKHRHKADHHDAYGYNHQTNHFSAHFFSRRIQRFVFFFQGVELIWRGHRLVHRCLSK